MTARRGAIVLAVAAVLVVGRPSAVWAAVPGTASRPNIVMVLADDLDLAEMQQMPHTQRLIGSQGATFDQYFVSDSLCCPLRGATILSGRYAHNTGVHSNGGAHGGFQAAYRNHLEDDTIATRLHSAGYRTGLFGKYLNRYPGTAGDEYVPPGWDTWASPVGGAPYFQYRYLLNVSGAVRRFGAAPTDYGTDVYMRMARRFAVDAAARHQPFFAYVAPYAPHWPAIAAPEDLAKFPDATAPRDPAYDLADVSRMPAYVKESPQFTTAEEDAIDRLYRRRIRSLQAIDRGVAHLVRTLRHTGELSRTYFVFTSDNGYHLGQHRLPAGKKTPYDTDIHVPLLVRGPGVPAGSHVDALSGNVDLAPTFAAIGGTRPPQPSDGQSLLSVAHRGEQASPARWRDAYLLEHWTEARASRQGRPSALEPLDPDEGSDVEPVPVVEPTDHPYTLRGPYRVDDRTVFRGRHLSVPRYEGLRTGRYVYVEYRTGERELYDTALDPNEIDNLAGRDPLVEARLARKLQRLRHCRGRACLAPSASAVT